MSTKVTYNGKIKNDGTFHINNVKQFKSDCVKAFQGKEIRIEVKKKKKDRSLSQNAYLWSVVYSVALEGFRHFGNTMNIDDVHEYFKNEFLSNRNIVINSDGEVKRLPGTTTTLSTSDMSDYIENIKVFVLQNMGVQIPSPNEQTGLFIGT